MVFIPLCTIDEQIIVIIINTKQYQLPTFMVKDIFTLPLSFVLVCVCIGGRERSLERLIVEKEEKSSISSKTGLKEGFRLQTTRRKRKRGPVCKPKT